MSNQLRLFVAIELPQSVKQELVRIQTILHKEHCFDGMYVDPKQAHITMKFIGAVKTDQVDAIKKALKSIFFTPCVAQLNKVGIFCADAFIKIVYVNVNAPALFVLAADLDKQLLPWCQPAARDFVSHVTLARVKHVQDRQRLHDVVNGIKVTPITFEISSFVLMQSVLGTEGPMYVTLQTYQ